MSIMTKNFTSLLKVLYFISLAFCLYTSGCGSGTGGNQDKGKASSPIIVANESAALRNLRAIEQAETAYLSAGGGGEVASINELEESKFLSPAFAGETLDGYKFSVKPHPRVSAAFTISAIPATYGQSGINSYFRDAYGTIHKADKEGKEATASDPSALP